MMAIKKILFSASGSFTELLRPMNRNEERENNWMERTVNWVSDH